MLLKRYSRTRRKNIGELQRVFDKDWYLDRYPDVYDLGVPPIKHYLFNGAREFRFPHLLFDEDWYQRCNPDVASRKIPGLLHYLLFGSAEGRSPHPLVHEKWLHAQMGGDIKSRTGLEFFLENWYEEEVSPHPLFDTKRYVSKYLTGESQYINPLSHYLTEGFLSGNQPHVLFNELWYRETYPDVVSSNLPGLVHYIKHGAAENRSPHPYIDVDKLSEI
jgi:hypothetical protein